MATYTGDEIFQMAMEMEETGEVLYEAMAAAARNDAVSNLCRRLAAQERQHHKVFERMRQALPTGRPARWEAMEFDQALINDRIVPDPGEALRIASSGSLTETLELAIQLERDAVSFYSDMLKCVEAGDAEAVGRIIEEERRHAEELLVARRNLH